MSFLSSKNNQTYNQINCIVCSSICEDMYGDIMPGLEICSKCANTIANVYSKKHTGLFLTWENEDQTKPHDIRKSISHGKRMAVFERDKYRCKDCETHIDLCIDHKIPISKGGTNDIDNLQTLCRRCNSTKGAIMKVA